MVSNETKWIRIFDIQDITKHPKGFTIYKIMSLLYPENCPDAITKVTVWKRFSNFKHLHKDMKSLHKKLKIRDAYPSLSATTFFKRFDDEVIQQRKDQILGFLEYISQHSQLFTSTVFVKFFEMSYSKLSEKPYKIDPESSSLASHDSDCTISDDTDSVSTVSSSMVQVIEETKKIQDTFPILFKVVVGDLELFSYELFASSFDNIPCNSEYYIADAEKFFSIASEAEIEKEFKLAWRHYMQGAYILVRYGKDDSNPDRRLKAKFKLEKFYIRLERIFYLNLYEIVQLYLLENFGESFANLIFNDLNNLHFEQLINMQKFEPAVYASADNEHLLLSVQIGSIVILNYPVSYSTSKVQSTIMKRKGNDDDKFVLVVDESGGDQKLSASFVDSEVVFMDLLKADNTNKQKLGQMLSKNLLNGSSQVQKQPKNNLVQIKQSKDLYNYKVTSILGKSLILTSQKQTNEIYVVKVLQKTYAQPNNNLVLPTNVPYMMRLHTWYETEDAIFLIIKHKSSISIKEYKNKNGKKWSTCQRVADEDVDQSDKEFEYIDMPPSSNFGDNDNGSLDDYEEFFENDFDIPMAIRKRWMAQLVLALEKLHQCGIICCNLSMSDLSVDENEDIYINYKYRMGRKTVYSYNNSIDFYPPEVYCFEEITESIDWWSLGALFYELLAGLPLNEAHPGGVFNYTILRFPKRVPYHGRILVQQLLDFNVKSRLGSRGVEEIKSHAFFYRFDWNSL